MTVLALLRHGQSQWNLQNRFTGWADANLTAEGEAEARLGGELMAQAGFAPQRAYTSVLTRAIRTLNLALEGLDRVWIPVEKDWRLNERHYGGLTGLDKQETRDKHGEDQVKIWRRSYDVPPPPMADDHPDNMSRDPRYRGVSPTLIPNAESLKLTLERVLPCWETDIAPKVKAGETIIIAAHGNSIRALIKHLFNVSDAEIVDVEVPTGNPLLVEFPTGSLSVTGARYLDQNRAKPLPAIPELVA